MTIIEVVAKMKTLHLPKGSFVVFGSGPLAALGIREVQDIDLLVSKEEYQKLENAGWQTVNKGEKDNPLVHGDFEAHASWSFSTYSPTLSELLSRAFDVEGIPFASLDDVQKWKQASGRLKDLDDLKLIRNYRAKRATASTS